jgi:pyruvate/2-oxoglutarate dehydrogenase complex dihydrolipoamide dehydrogenase (E3) component
VTLFEADGELGGQIRLAARLPGRDNFLEVIRFLTTQVRKLGVDVRIGQRVGPEAVVATDSEAVVIATGSGPTLPDLPGSDGRVFSVWEVLAERTEIGESVLVVDAEGHLRGCGVADYLAGRGKRVRIAGEHLYVGHNIDLKTLYPLYRRLREQGVEMLPGTRFEGWDGGPVVSDVFTGTRRTLTDVDTVVWAGPGQADAALVQPLRAAGLEVHAAGDCLAPRRLENAVREGHQVGRAV